MKHRTLEFAWLEVVAVKKNVNSIRLRINDLNKRISAIEQLSQWSLATTGLRQSKQPKQVVSGEAK